MRIITISRQFGSGGRELGKRMSELLGWDYYDREIITGIAREQGLDADYVGRLLEHRPRQAITIRRSFTTLPRQNPGAELLGREKQVIEAIAARGRDCVIVGRNADVFLRRFRPFSLFVWAEPEERKRRCRERAEAGEQLTDRALERSIRRIDRNRAAVRELVGGSVWGAASSYRMTVDTTRWPIPELSPVLAELALHWFEREVR